MATSLQWKKPILLAVCGALAFGMMSRWDTIQAQAPQVIAKLTDAVGISSSSIGSLEGEAAVLMNEQTGEVLYGKNEHERLYPASTTKLLTALIALEQADPDAWITVGEEARLRTAGESSAGLQEGDKLQLRDLIAAMLLPSGNDAARTVARYIAQQEEGRGLTPEESIEVFAQLMNERAKALGATESHFVNPHGLHDPNHYTTASDLALIARKARQNLLLCQLVGESEYMASDSGVEQTFVNRNKLLQPGSGYYFDGANGMKTGYTSEAGYCLVASAKRSGTGYIAIVLKSSSEGVWLDAAKLLDYGFKRSHLAR
ncbi:D-alanyl-D-alanine carboxypeptidase (penicillin-binding protein 5/6) [Paenibacillus phyllosphaerae]|uniref:D-alanyl-D-alanine carboxypeptidase (Penicillin-binding protein 5/6) n=1 Tax=Paenibacillus phyllosphaerae TaxID=274593 RepID=A0A7W5B2Y7_9BACL|nr:D-alanyl-D-alanine carboxypeptidase family protein [Paenibacillus phyllosphaerae]MBB3113480.1 D-alanyl-D-alanine carboxypeptidase (penicillin-binding protein 5/6) [Paenibacillus phyllosphaerae]